VERLHDYLERSFLPGRRFASPADFNDQLCGFLARANQRRHRVLGCRPVERLEGDQQAMLSLPAVPPVTGWRAATRLPRDHYLRLDGNDYSVHPAVIGGGSNSSPTWIGCRCGVRAGWSRTIRGCGPSTKPSLIRRIGRLPTSCAETGLPSFPHPVRLTSSGDG